MNAPASGPADLSSATVSVPVPEPSRPLVSLLLIAFRQPETVGTAVAAALAQSYSPLEIIVSDDASPDTTFAAMQAALAGYHGPHTVRLNRNARNLGIGAHLSHLAAKARGELLVVAAGDDVSLPERCEHIVAAWLAHDRRPDLIASALIDLDADGAAHGKIVPDDLGTYRSAADWLARPPHVVGAAHAWSRRLFDRFGPLAEGVVGEDLIMVLRAILSGGAISLPEPLVGYRRGGLSRRRRTLSADDVVARLLKNNRGALVELRQLLADAATAGQLGALQGALEARLAREHFIRDLFATGSLAARLRLALRSEDVPATVRLRMLAYAAFPGLLAPWFLAKRLFHSGRMKPGD
jgi:glycosyltransferase involved in cell wall biosynthesis